MKIDEILERGGNFNEIRELGDLSSRQASHSGRMVRAVALVGTFDDVRRRLSDLSALGVTDVFYKIDSSPGGIDALPAVIARLTNS